MAAMEADADAAMGAKAQAEFREVPRSSGTGGGSPLQVPAPDREQGREGPVEGGSASQAGLRDTSTPPCDDQIGHSARGAGPNPHRHILDALRRHEPWSNLDSAAADSGGVEGQMRAKQVTTILRVVLLMALVTDAPLRAESDSGGLERGVPVQQRQGLMALRGSLAS